jgi:hypothetical protein
MFCLLTKIHDDMQSRSRYPVAPDVIVSDLRHFFHQCALVFGTRPGSAPPLYLKDYDTISADEHPPSVVIIQDDVDLVRRYFGCSVQLRNCSRDWRSISQQRRTLQRCNQGVYKPADLLCTRTKTATIWQPFLGFNFLLRNSVLTGAVFAGGMILRQLRNGERPSRLRWRPGLAVM